jgi:hypothetical protein
MQRTLREHIPQLERKIESLKKEIHESGKSLRQQREISIDLGIAERSLVHFRKAFELEQRLPLTLGKAAARPARCRDGTSQL